MYTNKNSSKTTIRVNQSTEGKTIEAKVRKMVHDKEPIEDGADLHHQRS